MLVEKVMTEELDYKSNPAHEMYFLVLFSKNILYGSERYFFNYITNLFQNLPNIRLYTRCHFSLIGYI